MDPRNELTLEEIVAGTVAKLEGKVEKNPLLLQGSGKFTIDFGYPDYFKIFYHDVIGFKGFCMMLGIPFCDAYKDGFYIGIVVFIDDAKKLIDAIKNYERKQEHEIKRN